MDHMRISGTEPKHYRSQNFSTQSQEKALSFRQILLSKLVKNSTILHTFFKNFSGEEPLHLAHISKRRFYLEFNIKFQNIANYQKMHGQLSLLSPNIFHSSLEPWDGYR